MYHQCMWKKHSENGWRKKMAEMKVKEMKWKRNNEGEENGGSELIM